VPKAPRSIKQRMGTAYNLKFADLHAPSTSLLQQPPYTSTNTLSGQEAQEQTEDEVRDQGEADLKGMVTYMLDLYNKDHPVQSFDRNELIRIWEDSVWSRSAVEAGYQDYNRRVEHQIGQVDWYESCMSAGTVLKNGTFYNNVKELLSPPAPSSRAHETDQYESDEDDYDYYDDDDPVINALRDNVHDGLLNMIEAIVRFFHEDHAIHNIDPAVVADNCERTIWNESYEVEDYQRRAKVALDEGDTYEQDAKGIDICPGAAPGDFFYATMKEHMRDQNVPNQAQHEQPAAVDQVKEALLNSLEFRKGQLSGPDTSEGGFG
jgi:hypothetical protein